MNKLYDVSSFQFGKYEGILLEHLQENASLSIVPQCGGVLLSLKLKGIEVIEGYQSEKDLVHKSWNKCGLMLPFPNRLEDGTYQFDGKTYQFPINEKQASNNLHGIFPLNYDFHLLSIEENEAENSISSTLIFEYDGALEYYPFPFQMELTYKLLSNASFEVTFKAYNIKNKAMPIGFGWHPYFVLPNGDATKWQIELPECKQVVMNERQLPTGEKKVHDYFKPKTLKTIGDVSLDDCFALEQNEKKPQTRLFDGKHTLIFWQEYELFPFMQLFVPPSKLSIAWEPMTCNVNAFQNKEGLQILKQGESISGKFGLQLL